MDYKAIAKAILLCGSEPSVRRCEKECPYYKGGDTKKCIPRMTKDASATITNLLARAEAAEFRCKMAEKCFDESALHACETQLELEKKARAEAEARAEKAERERDEAVKELDGVAAAVDDLSDFIDEQLHPLIQYDMYLALRENADAISMWQYESEWRREQEEQE